MPYRVVVPGMLVVLCGCSSPAQNTRVPVLLPVASWSGATDSLLGSPIDVAAMGCKVAAADFNTRSVVVKTGRGPWQTIGRLGSGPGEYQMPGRVVFLPSGGMVVYDLALRRLIRFGAGGGADGAPVVLQVPYRHPSGGTLLGVDDSTLADYWLGARIPIRPIPDSAVAGLPVVARIGLDGRPHGGWGQARVPPHGSAATAAWHANAGAMAIRDGRLFVLRRYDGVLEEYDLKTGRLLRTDSLAPIAARSAYEANGEGMAGAVAALDGGHLALILRDPKRSDGEVYPGERLVVVDSLRRVVDSYLLTTRNNRLASAGGGYLFAAGEADSTRTDDADVVIDLLKLPGFDATDRCGWAPALQ